jgi:anaerobic ribonucleoside-triphosphate reductase
MEPTIERVIKRSGEQEKFNLKKIISAVNRAYKSCKITPKEEKLEELKSKFSKLEIEVITVDKIHEIVSEFLEKYDPTVAKKYVAKRKDHTKTKDFVKRKIGFINKYKKTDNTANSTIDDNSNVSGRNIGILNAEIHKEDNIDVSRAMITSKLEELFPDFDPKQYVEDLESHIIYKHDESSFAGSIAPYCVSLTMYPFLTNGINKIGGLSAKPKNLDSFCGMYINLIFATSAQFAGAVATSEVLLYFDYFSKKEWGDDYYLNPETVISSKGCLREKL